MAVNDRMFEPPASDLAKINARLGSLPPPLTAWIRGAGEALAKGDLRAAQAVLGNALALAPRQPDVLRLYGLLLARVGNFPAAIANLEAALRVAPDDAMGYWQYAQVCEDRGDVATAFRLRESAVKRLPESPLAWGDLGEHLVRKQKPEQALEPLERASRLAPDYAPVQLKLGAALVACGRAGEGAAAIRRAIAIEPAFGAAWLALADIKTAPITDDEAERMLALLRGGDIDESERTAIEFVLAREREDRGDYSEAFGFFLDANARRRREIGPWDAEGFLTRAKLSKQIFEASHTIANAPRLGEQVFFVVGLPRSGTTLIEQILASHPLVKGAGELGELAQVLTEESERLRQRFPEWVPTAKAQDWQRLGERYLELTAPHREGQAYFTDKMPNNWQVMGAIRAMLPGARIVICRRDPLENCWSCFKQYFPSGWEFANDIAELGLFWKTFDRAAKHSSRRAPERVREQSYERLTEDPETEIHALLDFCGLPFDPACLHSHESRRSVQTLSAAQVREPVRRHRSTAARYKGLLDPLRHALGLPAWADTDTEVRA